MRSTRPTTVTPDRAARVERLFTESGPALWRAMYAVTAGRPAFADDVVAEAFARLLEHLDTVREPVPWLYRTAFRLAADELRRERRAVAEPDRLSADAAGLGDLVPALRRLSPAQRAAIVLHYEADLPVAEVARRMGTSVSAVKVHLHRGRRKLRTLLGSEEVSDV